MSGCCAFNDSNIPSRHAVELQLFLPPLNQDGIRVALQMKAKILNTVLSSKVRQFRCSVVFESFAETGKATLERLVGK